MNRENLFTKSLFSEKINKIDIPVDRLIRRGKKEMAQIANIRNEKSNSLQITHILKGQ